MKGAAFLFLLICCASFALAAPPFGVQKSSDFTGLVIQYPKILAFPLNGNVTLHFHVYNITGLAVTGNNATCTLHVYNSTTGKHIVTANMPPDGVEYDYTLPQNVTGTVGVYQYIAQCNQTAAGYGGFANTEFEITRTGSATASGEDLSPISALIIVPLLLGILLLIGAATLDGEKHAALKTGVFLFSVVPFFASMYLGGLAVARFYNFEPFGNAISEIVFYVGVVFGVLCAYFLLYVFYLVIQQIRAKKEERLRY